MNCPTCPTTMSRTRYEGLPVYFCENCKGYAVSSMQRAEAIKRRRNTNAAELEKDASLRKSDSSNPIRCPSCNAQMEKEKREDHSFLFDVCSVCQMVWFDPGELAQMQLDHERSDQGQEDARFQDRLQHMSENDRQAFEQRLSELPEGDVTGLGGVLAGIRSALTLFRR